MVHFNKISVGPHVPVQEQRKSFDDKIKDAVEYENNFYKREVETNKIRYPSRTYTPVDAFQLLIKQAQKRFDENPAKLRHRVSKTEKRDAKESGNENLQGLEDDKTSRFEITDEKSPVHAHADPYPCRDISGNHDDYINVN